MICAVFSRLNRCNSFNRYRASVASGQGRRKKEESQKIDDLPVLACWSGTLAIGNIPVALGNA